MVSVNFLECLECLRRERVKRGVCELQECGHSRGGLAADLAQSRDGDRAILFRFPAPASDSVRTGEFRQSLGSRLF